MAIEAATISATQVGTKNAMQFQSLFAYVIPFECKVLEASIAAGLASAGDITVPGAKLGDFVLLSVEFDVDDLIVVGQVTAADRVTLFVQDASEATNTTLATTARVVRGLVLGTADSVWNSVSAA
jgi:hypothetical protein